LQGIEQGRPCAYVLVFVAKAIDRGACIRDLSQYQDEIEYLYLPCSFIQPNGQQTPAFSEHGLVTLIPCDINVNLKSQTVEEMVAHKKQMHLSSFRFIMDEIKRELEETAEKCNAAERRAKDRAFWKASRFCDRTRDIMTELTLPEFLNQIVEQCEDVFRKHEGIDSSDFVLDDVYRMLVEEMMECKMFSLSKLLWWIEDEEQCLGDPPGCCNWSMWYTPLREAHQRRIAFWERLFFKADAQSAEKVELATKLCKMKGIIKQSVDEVNDLGEPPILRKTASGEDLSLETIRLLAAAKADVNLRSGRLLVAAAGNGDSSRVKCLHSLGAELGFQALECAVMSGQSDATQALIDLKADMEAGEHGFSALIRAAESNQLEIIRILVLGGANMEAVNMHGSTPFTDSQGNDETRSLLLSLGAVDPSSLRSAARCGDIKDVIPAMEQVVSKTCACEFGALHPALPALVDAAGAGFTEMVRALLDLKVDVNIMDKESKNTPLRAARANGHEETEQVLLSHGAVDDKFLMKLMMDGDESAANKLVGSFGENAVYFAAQEGDAPAIQALVDYGCSFGSDGAGLTPLMYAANHGHVDAVRILAQLHDCVDDCDHHGLTALMKAAMKGDALMVMELGHAGADLDAVDGYSYHGQATALFLAAQHGQVESVKALVCLKADVLRATNGGETPLDVAERENHRECVDALRQALASSR
jgi:ankyrin repeat protein